MRPTYDEPMPTGSLGNWVTPGEDTVLGRLMTRWQRHEREFECGVRVVSGELPGEHPRWRFRRSAADPLVVDGVVTVNHGAGNALRLRIDAGSVAEGTRPGYVRFTAVEQTTNARVEVSVAPAELERFGLPPV
jgi:hypothetical protein